MNNTDKQISAKIFNRIVIVLGAVLILLIVFQAGMAVGFKRARFSMSWSENYMHGFRDPQSILAPFSMMGDEINPHGTVGEIISVKLPEIMIKGANNVESILHVTSTTSIKNFRGVGTTTDLKAGDQVVVIGRPLDNGSIEASFIRIIPNQPPVSRENADSRRVLPPLVN